MVRHDCEEGLETLVAIESAVLRDWLYYLEHGEYSQVRHELDKLMIGHGISKHPCGSGKNVGDS